MKTIRFHLLGETILANVDELKQTITDAIERHAEKERARTRIVCLCGSTRFGREYREENARLTLEGYIVLSIGCSMKSDLELFGHLGPSERRRTKEMLDELHLSKIDLCDLVRVINVGGYIGESTSVEIAYAAYLCKPVIYLEEKDA